MKKTTSIFLVLLVVAVNFFHVAQAKKETPHSKISTKKGFFKNSTLGGLSAIIGLSVWSVATISLAMDYELVRPRNSKKYSKVLSIVLFSSGIVHFLTARYLYPFKD